MPFPFLAHQAAVLPLKLRWPRLSGTGLVLGSMAPDFAYFLLGGGVTRDWHRPHGVLLFCLPVGFAMYLLVTRWLVAPVARHMPVLGQFHLERLAYLEAQPRSVVHFAMVAACIVAGGGTHLAWDLFTHDGTWMGERIPWLADEAFRLFGRGVRGSGVLWVLSTVLGGLFSLLALRDIGGRGLLHRWAEARAPGSTDGIDPMAPAATSHAAFWLPVVVAFVGGAVTAFVMRPPGFEPLAWATGVLVFLRAASLGFLALAFSAWRERRAWRHRSSGTGGAQEPRRTESAA